MKLLPRLIIAVLVCLVAIPVLAIPEQVQAGGSIDISPSSGNVGDRVYIYGTGFGSSAEVDIYYYFDSARVLIEENYEVGTDGNFTYHFDIPESYKGRHYIRVCSTNLSCASAYFTVEPKIEVDAAIVV